MSRVYIAGPMRGYPQFNHPAFFEAEERLKSQWWEVSNPARNDAELDGFDPEWSSPQKLAHYMRRDIPAVMECQAIAMLPGWRESEGANIEFVVATALGLDVLDAMTGEPLVETGDPAYLKLLADMNVLHRSKAAGYSGIGAVDVWANFREAEKWGVSALKGCLVRLGDKYRRCQNLVKNPANDQVREPLEDTLLDMASYSLIAICLLKETKRVDA